MCSRGPGYRLVPGFPLLLLPAFFLVVRAQGGSVPLVTALSGTSVTLHIPGLPTYTWLTWMFNKEQKILDWDDEKITIYDKRFYDRVNLSNSSLVIHNVQKEDSSTYLLNVFKPDGEEVEKKIQLKVFEPVPKPTVKIESTRVENKRCVLNLSCVVPTPDVTYIWFENSDKTKTISNESVLQVTLQENGAGSYNCCVSNPVSSNYNTVKHTPPCTSDNSSGMAWGAAWHTILWPTLLLVLLA